MGFWQLFKRELQQLCVLERQRALLLFGAPLAYLLLFFLIYSPHVINSVPMVIYDENQTQLSRRLVQAFADSERFNIVEQVNSEQDLQRMLSDKTAYAALHIAAKMMQDAKNVRSSTVMLIADGSNLMITTTVTASAQEIISMFSADTGVQLVENIGLLPGQAVNKITPIEFRLRVLNNPTQDYLVFIVFGLALAALQQGIFLSVGASLIYEYQSRTELRQVSPIKLLVTKFSCYSLGAIASFLLTMTIAIKGFGFHCTGSYFHLLLLVSAYIFAAIGFASLVASVCKSLTAFTKASVAYTTPAFVLSGYTWPQHGMDTFTQTLSYTFPLTYLINTTRELMGAGYSPHIIKFVLILLTMGIIFTSLALVFYTQKIHAAQGREH